MDLPPGMWYKRRSSGDGMPGGTPHQERNYTNNKLIYRIDTSPIHRLIHDAQEPCLDSVAQIAANMRRFGIVNPALVDRYENIISNERILAASRLGLTRFLVIMLDQQSEGHPPAPRITGRKIVDNTPWDNGAGHGRLTETKQNTKDKDK